MVASSHGPDSTAVQSYFDYVAEGWSAHYASDGTMAGRIERFLDAVQDPVRPDLRVLDFGCGSGELARAMAAKGWGVTGCDISRKMLQIAKDAPGGDDVDWRAVETAGNLPFGGGVFDLVTASSVFEYIAAPEASLAELCRILIPGGLLLLTVPDMRHPARLAEERSRQSLVGRLKRGLRHFVQGGADTDYWKYSVQRHTPGEWHAMLRAVGFVSIRVGSCDDPLLLLAGRTLETGDMS